MTGAFVFSRQFDLSIEIVDLSKYEFVAVWRTEDHAFRAGLLEEGIETVLACLETLIVLTTCIPCHE